MDADTLELTFSGELWQWRGPAPYYFITVPADAGGRAPCRVDGRDLRLGRDPGGGPPRGTAHWSTSLFPKDGGYLVPIKQAVRLGERLADGDTVELRLTVRL